VEGGAGPGPLSRSLVAWPGRPLTGPERDDWLAAKTRFEEYERAWDQIYQAGVVVVAGGDDEEDDDDPGSA
jgi:hypothetical protein